MRRLASIGMLVAACCAGVFVAVLLATPIAGADDGTTTIGTTAPPPTETTPPPTTTPTVPKPPKRAPRPTLIQPGVTIGGTLVGGLTVPEARALVEGRFDRSLTLVASRDKKSHVTPQELGATVRLVDAVKLAARVRRPGFVVPLKVEVNEAKLGRYLERIAADANREPRDAQLELVELAPVATPSLPGRRLEELIAARQLSLMLRKHERGTVELPFEELKPAVTESDFSKAIVIRRGSNRLLLYTGTKLKRTFRVATGRSSYPTPLGRYEVINKQLDPWWYPPTTSEWARDSVPIPPGPGNPLGTRWMGISAPYVGIHGTPDAASIGYSASHGCIRMLIPEVEWLFAHVDVGTPVFIVPA